MPFEILVLNEQVKPVKDTIFNAETAIKNIHKKENKTSRKKLSVTNIEFLKSLVLSYEISEMADVLKLEVSRFSMTA